MQINNISKLNILLIQFKPAGDVLLLTPVVKAIKKNYTDSRVTFMVNEKESLLVKDFKLIDELILLKKLAKNGFANHMKYIKYNISLILLVRKNKYDVVIDFIGNPKSALLTILSGAALRIGRKGKRSIAYNNKIEDHTRDLNTVIRRLSHLKPLGIDPEYIAPELNLNDNDILFADDYISSLGLPGNRMIIILAPNSPRSSRRWKAEYFTFTGKALAAKYRAKILLAWGPGEEGYTTAILNGIGSDAEMIPRTSLTEMAAIISKADLIITNDSSPKHIANALGVRSIAIYGPTNPYVWNDIDMKRNPALRADVPCIQCEKRVCPLETHLCMEKLTPDMVLKTADAILNNR